MRKAIQSVERVLSIIELFNKKNYELGTKEISKQLILSKSTGVSTVHCLIKTLESNHYLTQNPDNKKYKLGRKSKLFSLTQV
jgi:IclR family transcriptional regulator, KDG regulon repressor